MFFNRGVASSQAYARAFQNQKPDQITDPVKRKKAFQWLSRDLDEALFKFIDQAKAGDTLLGCFYEFRYAPAADRLKAAVDRGVNVRLILDAKVNEFTDKHGKFHESFPREDNKRTVAKAKLPDSAIALWREHNPSDIEHNKFLVLLRGQAAAPAEVWTGSTNLSLGGIHGQTNVGHWVRNAAVAAAYRNYWELVQGDPGTAKGDTRTRRTPSASSTAKAVDGTLRRSGPLAGRRRRAARRSSARARGARCWTCTSPWWTRPTRSPASRSRSASTSASRTGSPTTLRAATSRSSCSRSGT